MVNKYLLLCVFTCCLISQVFNFNVAFNAVFPDNDGQWWLTFFNGSQITKSANLGNSLAYQQTSGVFQNGGFFWAYNEGKTTRITFTNSTAFIRNNPSSPSSFDIPYALACLVKSNSNTVLFGVSFIGEVIQIDTAAQTYFVFTSLSGVDIDYPQCSLDETNAMLYVRISTQVISQIWLSSPRPSVLNTNFSCDGARQMFFSHSNFNSTTPKIPTTTGAPLSGTQLLFIRNTTYFDRLAISIGDLSKGSCSDLLYFGPNNDGYVASAYDSFQGIGVVATDAIYIVDLGTLDSLHLPFPTGTFSPSNCSMILYR